MPSTNIIMLQTVANGLGELKPTSIKIENPPGCAVQMGSVARSKSGIIGFALREGKYFLTPNILFT